ncbi:MAG TPA: hypothetical protein VLH86_04060 [Patescibacteria group bacterium]|nr:hypothetical protein [Patescibacteria group bacterium]
MSKKNRLLIPLLAVAFAVAVFAVPQIARAENDATDSSGDTSQSSDDTSSDGDKTAAGRRTEAEQKRLEAVKAAQERRQEELSKKTAAEQERDKRKQEAFQKACENRRNSFETRLGNIDRHYTNHLATLDKITERVKTFKTDKNLTVANYDALVADVAAKRQAVVDLQATLKQQADAFTCGNDQTVAKANLQVYKDALRQEIDAMKAYRTSVKNLIVAVKTAAAAKEGTSND